MMRDEKVNASIGVPAAVRKVPLNLTNFGRVINSILQSSLTSGGATTINDTNDNDMANTFAVLWTDLQGAMGGLKSLFNTCPNFYRHLFEAVSPTTTKTEPAFTFQFDELTFSTTPTVPDGVCWGVIESNNYGSTGLGTVGIFNPSNSQFDQIASAGRIFQRFANSGHKMWKEGDPDTDGKDDPSAFAAWLPNPTSEFIDGFGAVSLECKIRTTWLACLGLTPFNANRTSNYILPFYALPQTYMGHRIMTKYTGRIGNTEQVRVQALDANSFLYQVAGVFNTGAEQFRQSAIVPGNNTWEDGSITNINQMMVYLATVLYTATLRESGATLGYGYSNAQCLAWGNQYLGRDTATTSAQNFFSIVIENLRRLKVISDDVNGTPTYVYNVFIRKLPELSYFTPEWLGKDPSFPPSWDVNSCSDPTVAINFNLEAGTCQEYFEKFVSASSILGQFTPLGFVTNEREQSTQLTNLVRILINPSNLNKYAVNPGTYFADKGAKRAAVLQPIF